MSRDQAQNPNFLFEKLHRQYKSDFPNLIERSVYNKRRRLLAPLMNKVRQRLVHKLVPSEDTFVLDSMPMEVCKFARANRVKVCKEQEETAPAFGYCADKNQTYYMGTNCMVFVP